MNITMDAQVWGAFATYSTIILLKLLAMPMIIAVKRKSTKVFMNTEDTKVLAKGKVGVDEKVERVRRAHLNDMENIYAFVLIGIAYCLTSPAYASAKLLFRVFVGSRFLHTVVYLHAIPQPARGIVWTVGWLVCLYMGAHTVLALWDF